jgi:hypothetical protein
MGSYLPYTVETESGRSAEFSFPLHPQTRSPVRVNQLLAAVLDTLDREIRLMRDVGNGDVMQALAMALAVRATMAPASVAATTDLADELSQTALAAARLAQWQAKQDDSD